MTEADARSLRLQSAAAARSGQRAVAIDLFRRSLLARPDDAEAWYEFGHLLKADGRYEDALSAFHRAIALGIARAEEVHVNCGVIQSDHLRRDDEALGELTRAIAANPSYLPALLNLGNLYEEQGRREQALEVYARAIAVEPAAGDPHADLRLEALARSCRLQTPSDPQDPMLERLRRAATEPASATVRANVLFALGQAAEKLGDADSAFDAFAKANRWILRGSGRRYDRTRIEAYFDAIREAFPTPVDRVAGDTPPRPLFVCGLFRSGSTLVEQVLAAHPDVTPGGELAFLPRLAAEALAPFPAGVEGLAPQRFEALADSYRQHLLKLFPEARDTRYVTDKRPDNFTLIGLIKCMFPDARIVHTVRHPVDNGLSIFMQHLHLQVAPYSADLADIGHYYGQYRRLMDHWQALYPDTILEFDYDAFVADPRTHLGRLLDFLGLPWNDDCLDFHRLGNTVKTASYWQVRQPLNASASGRWRRYRTHVAPLLAELDRQGIRYE